MREVANEVVTVLRKRLIKLEAKAGGYRVALASAQAAASANAAAHAQATKAANAAATVAASSNSANRSQGSERSTGCDGSAERTGDVAEGDDGVDPGAGSTVATTPATPATPAAAGTEGLNISRQMLQERRELSRIQASLVQAQQSITTCSGLITTILLKLVAMACSYDLQHANAMAGVICERVSAGDAQFVKLIKAPFALELFGVITENWAPVTGCLRRGGSGKNGAAVRTPRHVLALLAKLAPEAVKHMDDECLNIHLSRLCNSLATAANDVMRVLRERNNSTSPADLSQGQDHREGSQQQQPPIHAGGGGSSKRDGQAGRSERAGGGESSNSSREDRPENAGVRLVREVVVMVMGE